ncbi:MAG: phosphoribosylformylglycinamidine synthase subunit PurL [Candidatus Omnitrophica bacterium]|nr:phosphoribosylformylglycinamidine synthase subunit PurL [Candidatus Omnitrophota bacterium]
MEVRDKKNIYDAVSEGLKQDIKDIGIKKVKSVEYIQVYTLSGNFSKKDLKYIAEEILTDKVSQECDYNKGFSHGSSGGTHVIEIAYNPGVMDPVEESVMKAAKDAGIKGISSAATSKRYVIKGPVSKPEVKKITDRLLYNKIIQHVVTHREEQAKLEKYTFKRVEVDILGAGDRALKRLSIEGQLYLSLTEMKAIQDYYGKLGRNPTDCELETLAQTWSEHCNHKTMMGSVNYNGKTIKNLLKETVMKVTRELDRPWCVSVFKDNAGIIRFDSKHDICFKVETHNHPSALEPYGGAETGIGGVLRDPMGTGRGSKPIINTDVFCFGMPDMSLSSVPKGALHPKRVLKGVVSGVRDYGNKMGIPTVNGAVCFDERYTGNPLVYCGNVGIMPHKFSTKKVSSGDLIVAVGGRTGRDGIHGATFSSAELTSESETISSTAVQIGNPITEKKMLDTLIKARDRELYDAITDCGAGGFSSAVGEMGEETGAEVHLEKIPLKYEGLKPWEIWVSEAQERMVLAVKPKNLKKLMDVFGSEDVEATVIGKFTSTKKLHLYYDGNLAADLDMKFLHNGLPKVTRTAVWKRKKEDKKVLPAKKKDHTKDLLEILSGWNVCSKEWIIRQYDHEVQGGSVLKPLVGVDNDGPSDASINRPFLNSNKGIAVSNGINPRYGDIDPYWMAASAIDEALRQIVAVGGEVDKTALLDNFCWGNTERKEQLGGLVRASQACYDMAKVYKTPFISGKDSLNNEFNTGRKTVSIPPTLLISAVSVVDDVRKTVSSDMKKSGNLIYVVGKTLQEMGGSQYFLVTGKKGGMVPRVDPVRSLKLMKKMTSAIKGGLIASAHDCSEGGIAVALAEMLFAGGLGAEVFLKKVPRERSITRDDVLLFSESNSRFIVEVPEGKKNAFEKRMKNIPVGFIGKVTCSTAMTVKGLKDKTVIKTGIRKLKENWQKPFKKLMHEGT